MSEGTATFRAFADILGVGRTYVTQLRHDDRLVLTGDGKRIRVAESIARIEATRDPARRSRIPDRGEPPADAGEPPSSTYQDARATKERYLALEAKRAYEVAVGKLVDSGEVRAAIADAVTRLRARLETLPNVLAPQLAAVSEEGAARALLAAEVEHALAECTRAFADVAKPPEAA